MYVSIHYLLKNPKYLPSDVVLQCRADVHEEMHDMSGPRVAEAYRNDRLHGRLRIFQFNKDAE